jgi:hypothetical protein
MAFRGCSLGSSNVPLAEALASERTVSATSPSLGAENAKLSETMFTGLAVDVLVLGNLGGARLSSEDRFLGRRTGRERSLRSPTPLATNRCP